MLYEVFSSVGVFFLNCLYSFSFCRRRSKSFKCWVSPVTVCIVLAAFVEGCGVLLSASFASLAYGLTVICSRISASASEVSSSLFEKSVVGR